MKAKIFGTILALCAMLFLAGCNPTITNLTSERVPQNASGIYTLSMAVSTSDGSIMAKSYKPSIVIDGQTHPMRPSPLGKNIFEYEYQMPSGRKEARFYYVLDYDVDYNGSASPRQTQSGELHRIELASRYVLTMESQRGPIGAEVAVVGRGFQRDDRISIGGYSADTVYGSSNALTFKVPPLPANRAYSVHLVSREGTIGVGNFYIDASRLQVSPQRLQLNTGERSVLALRLASPAPQGGLRITAQTDIPASLIMGDINVPAGSTSVSVPIQGGSAGNGMLYLSAAGYNRVSIPLFVQGAATIAAPEQQAPAPAPAPVKNARKGDISDASVTLGEVSEGQPVNVNVVNEITVEGGATQNQSRPLPSQTSETISVDGSGNIILDQSDLIPVTQ